MERSRLLPIRQYNDNFHESLSRAPWMTAVYLVPETHPCGVCLDASRVYDRLDIPETPVKGCGKSDGCGCWLAAVPASEERRPADLSPATRAA